MINSRTINTPDTTKAKPSLAGIGGWLIIPAIGLILGPIFGVVGLVLALTLWGDVARSGFGNLFALEISVAVGLVAFSVYAATQFFGKKRNAPSAITMLLIASLVCSALLLMVEMAAGAHVFAVETGKQILCRASTSLTGADNQVGRW